MLNKRTDLAIEAQEMWSESPENTTQLRGVAATESEREGYAVTKVEILDTMGEQALGKPMGQYVTVEMEGLQRREQDGFGRGARAIAGELTSLLPKDNKASVLVVGLGNRAITPDAIGPEVADFTLVTRHLVEQLPDQFGSFRSVSALAAGVLGTTGVESGEMVKGLVDKIQPQCVIAVDALASRSMNRVCRTVQLSNTGIVPGSGVGNHRSALNQETLGIPVIAIGVPTVVDGATLCADVLEEAGAGVIDPSALQGSGSDLMVTPKDIDQQIRDLSKVIGYGINLALQPDLSLADVEMLVG